MQKIVITKLQCQRCSHEWVPTKLDVRQCPKCKSARWDEKKGEAVNQ
jgi:Zn finger protein HypA/HybF involved in hydrogenase expression